MPLQERLMRQRIKSHRRLTLDALMPFPDVMLAPLPHSAFYLQIGTKREPTSGLEPLT